MTDQPLRIEGLIIEPDSPHEPATQKQLIWLYRELTKQNQILLEQLQRNEALFAQGKQSANTPAPAAQPKPAPPKPPAARPTPLASGPVVNNGRNLGLLNGKPKATESQWYDVYQIMVDEYAYDGAKVRFYRTGMQYQDAEMGINEKTEELFREVFGNWQPQQTETGKHLPVVAGRRVLLTIQCTGPEKRTSKGNPYHNIVKAESVEA